MGRALEGRPYKGEPKRKTARLETKGAAPRCPKKKPRRVATTSIGREWRRKAANTEEPYSWSNSITPKKRVVRYTGKPSPLRG
jgi:hypothetical protein